MNLKEQIVQQVVYYDQLKAIKLIRKSINDEIFIYVKTSSQFHIKDMP